MTLFLWVCPYLRWGGQGCPSSGKFLDACLSLCWDTATPVAQMQPPKQFAGSDMRNKAQRSWLMGAQKPQGDPRGSGQSSHIVHYHCQPNFLSWIIRCKIWDLKESEWLALGDPTERNFSEATSFWRQKLCHLSLPATQLIKNMPPWTCFVDSPRCIFPHLVNSITDWATNGFLTLSSKMLASRSKLPCRSPSSHIIPTLVHLSAGLMNPYIFKVNQLGSYFRRKPPFESDLNSGEERLTQVDQIAS